MTAMMIPMAPPAVPTLINRCCQDELIPMGTRPKATDSGYQAKGDRQWVPGQRRRTMGERKKGATDNGYQAKGKGQ